MSTPTVIDCRPAAPAPALTAIKSKQQAAWSSGDYAIVGTTLQIVGEQLAEAMDLRAGQAVLDIAAGNGNATLAAARRWCNVTSTDYVETLLARGKLRLVALPCGLQACSVEWLLNDKIQSSYTLGQHSRQLPVRTRKADPWPLRSSRRDRGHRRACDGPIAVCLGSRRLQCGPGSPYLRTPFDRFDDTLIDSDRRS